MATKVPCQYPENECDERDGGHTSLTDECTACGAYPPEEWESWKGAAYCEHPHCREVEGFYVEFSAKKRGGLVMTREEKDEILNDAELLRDEFHGDTRDLREAS